MIISQTMIALADGTQAILVTLADGSTRSYLNRCPHLGIPLDWGDGNCLTDDRELLICGMHAAIFDPESGECLAGPCGGKFLTKAKQPPQDQAAVNPSSP